MYCFFNFEIDIEFVPEINTKIEIAIEKLIFASFKIKI